MGNDIKRRGFLKTVTLTMGAFGCGAIGYGLIKSTLIDQNSLPADLSFDLNGLQAGDGVLLEFNNKPLAIRHLSDDQIKLAIEQQVQPFRYKFANNANHSKHAIALNENRFASKDLRYLILDPSCPRLGCITMFNAGDYDGWFCPCSGAHFDIAGRIRKGPSPHNLVIPKYEIDKNNQLIVRASPHILTPKEIEKLIKSK